jgi:DNA mismatch repair ATPase MutS
MHTDPQTNQDLELFQARDGGASVLTVLDRTATRPGLKRLSDVLRHPLSDPAAIRARLQAVAWLHRGGHRFDVPVGALEAVRAYVDSTYATASGGNALGRAVDSTLIALRYRDLLRHARGGVQAMGKLLSEVGRFMRRLDGGDAPTEVWRICEEVREVTDAIRSSGLADPGPYWRTLEVDRLLRSGLRDEIHRLLDLMAELDALAAAALLLDEGWVLPELVEHEGAWLEGEGLWHPFLPEAVRNPVSLRGGETLVFLTGPNMAGKTTYLRAVGLCMHLAHCGLPVPAERFAFASVDRFLTGLSPEDNLREGISYFLAEVRRVRQVVEAVARGERVVAIFDEVFRGTNVADALDASRAVLRGCSRADTSAFIFSSHLWELADELTDLDSVRLCYFDGDLGASELSFDYRLRSGVSSKRFGMELLRREGVEELLAGIGGA